MVLAIVRLAKRLCDRCQPLTPKIGAGVCCHQPRPSLLTMDTKAHWERVYATKRSDEVSWFQPVPDPSLRLLERAGIDPHT
jgi:hypothetical protein